MQARGVERLVADGCQACRQTLARGAVGGAHLDLVQRRARVERRGANAGQTVGHRQVRQAHGVFERRFRQVRQAVGQRRALHRGHGKCLLAHAGNAFGHVDSGKPLRTVKRAIADARELASLGERDFRKVVRTPERLLANGRHACGDDHALDVGAREHAVGDGRHVVGDGQVRGLTAITGQHAVLDNEVGVIGLLSAHMDGGGLLLACRVGNRGGNVGVARLALSGKRHGVGHLAQLTIGLLYLHHRLVRAFPRYAAGREAISHQGADLHRPVKRQLRRVLRQYNARRVGHLLHLHLRLRGDSRVVGYGHRHLGGAFGHAFELAVGVNLHHIGIRAFPRQVRLRGIGRRNRSGQAAHLARRQRQRVGGKRHARGRHGVHHHRDVVADVRAVIPCAHMHHVRERQPVVARTAPAVPRAVQIGNGDGHVPRARAVGVFDRVGHRGVVPTAGGHLHLVVLAVGLLRVVVGAHEVHTREPAAVGHIERDGALVALTFQIHIADLGFLSVVVERLVKRLLRGVVGCQRGRAAQRVLAVGQLVAVFVQAVEDRLVRRVDVVVLNVKVRAHAVVVRGLRDPVVAVAAHRFAVGVEVVVAQAARVALHDGERHQARGRVRCRRRRYHSLCRVGVTIAVQRVFAQRLRRVLVHDGAAHDVLVAAARHRVDGALRIPIAVEAQERSGQVDAAFAFGRQLHEAFHVGAVRGVFGYELLKRVGGSHVDHQRSAAVVVVAVVGLHGDLAVLGVASERHVDATARPVVVAAREQAFRDLLGHGGGIKRIRLRR